MSNSPLNVKLAICLGTLLVALYCLWPVKVERPGQPVETKLPITLGLDLQGGTYMVLQVDLDEAVASVGARSLSQLRGQLDDQGVNYQEAIQSSANQLRFTGLSDRTAAEDIFSNFSATWESDWTGDADIDLNMRPSQEQDIRDGATEQVRETISRRINEFGVAEPSITTSGEKNERIILQLPGLSEAKRAEDIITKQSKLEFRRSYAQGPTQQALFDALGVTDGQLPSNMVAVEGKIKEGDNSQRISAWYALDTASVCGGEDLINARPTSDEYGRPAISFTFSRDAGLRFGDFTKENIGNVLAVMLDDKVVTAPSIRAVIYSDGIIEGGYSAQEAQDTALTLRSGALPAKVDILYSKTVGATLGQESIEHGYQAATFGFVFVILFLLVWYKGAGVNALVALMLNMVLILAALAQFGAVLTLPGIAGIVLTIGMAVDANVIIFERIKEEYAAGKSPRGAVEAGFEKAFSAIFDANVTTLFAAFFLYNFGTGPIRGFAVTLALGICASLFTSLFVSRALFELKFEMLSSESLSISWTKQGERDIKFMSLRPVVAVLSMVAVIGGFGLWMSKGLNYGIDFEGGTQVTVKAKDGLGREALEQRLAGSEFAGVPVQVFGSPADNEFILRARGAEDAVATTTVNDEAGEKRESASTRLITVLVGESPTREQDLNLNAIGEKSLADLLETNASISKSEAEEAAGKVIRYRTKDVGVLASVESLTSLNLPEGALTYLQQHGWTSDLAVIEAASVGPAVGAELRKKAIQAIIWSLAAVLFYITYRFGAARGVGMGLRFGAAAIVALFHDVIVTIGIFSLMGWQVDITIIAALLTIVGYSLNDTIVVFDRIRENMHGMKRQTLLQIINRSLSQTLSRTLLTSGTTLVVVVALLVRGGAVLEGFAWALTIGVLIGTYSSIFVASPFVLLCEKFGKARFDAGASKG